MPQNSTLLISTEAATDSFSSRSDTKTAFSLGLHLSTYLTKPPRLNADVMALVVQVGGVTLNLCRSLTVFMRRRNGSERSIWMAVDFALDAFSTPADKPQKGRIPMTISARMNDQTLNRTFFFSQPSKIAFGYGTVSRVGKEAASIAGGGKAQIITDFFINQAGLVDPARESLERAGFDVEIWDGVRGEPTEELLEKTYEEVRGFDADVFVGIGGGSSLDTAKIVAGMMTNPGPLSDHFPKETGVGRFRQEPKPMVTVPTTAGTGAENTWFAVLALRGVPGKVGFVDPKLIPPRAVVDPGLTLGLPPRLTASTGLDALTHLIEGYLGRQTNPYTESLALEAVRVIPQYLRRAHQDGGDREARFYMMLQASLGGLAINFSGVNEGHVMGHMIGGRYHIPHGMAQGITLPYSIAYNIPHFPQEISRLARAWGADALGPEEAGRYLVEECVTLLKELGMPWKLSQVEGTARSHLVEIAHEIVTTPYFVSTANACCRSELTEEVSVALLENMYDGVLP